MDKSNDIKLFYKNAIIIYRYCK